MTMVVDTSVAIRWYVDAPGTSEALRILDSDEPLIAPDLVVAELANVAWKLVRSRQIGRDHGVRIAAAAASAFAALAASAGLASRAFEIGLEIDHPVYDCLYLALAETEETQVLTADKRLADAVRNSKWAALVELLAVD